MAYILSTPTPLGGVRKLNELYLETRGNYGKRSDT